MDFNEVIVEETTQHVISALVKSSDVYEAYNPGEYFYDGPEIPESEGVHHLIGSFHDSLEYGA